jgi:diaminohydroxyphosphoribosylaminopyrimidine deaminase/5-amino-6-(5-phosphoribosylamino)uracil reductase
MSQWANAMERARELASASRLLSPPNPWVGAVVLDETTGSIIGEGRTQPPGGNHAEIEALAQAGVNARGATLVVTLEPCSHTGRTGPCVEAIIDAGIARVVVAVSDPDVLVAGRGLARLREANIDLITEVLAEEVRADLAPYLHHRSTGRPYVVAKVAATLDGAVAMSDGSSQWITSGEARYDGHVLRAESQAIIVGAGTVRSDNPTLTARLHEGTYEPRRIVLGRAATSAKVQPCEEYAGPLEELLDRLGDEGVVQVLVEGGPSVVSSFITAGLAQRIVWYVAPALAGLSSALPALASLETETISALRRGRFVAIKRLGEDIRLDLEV